MSGQNARMHEKSSTPIMQNSFMRSVAVTAALVLNGCSNDDYTKLFQQQVDAEYPPPPPHRDVPSVPFHQYHGPPQYMQNYHQYNPHIQAYSYQHRFPVAQKPTVYSQPIRSPPMAAMYDPRQLAGLQTTVSRINDRRGDLNRVLHELDLDQRNFQAELSSVNSQFESSKQRIMSEYQDYLQSVQSMAAMQVSYPPEVIYVNAQPPPSLQPILMSSPYVQQGIIQPMALPPPPPAPIMVQAPPPPAQIIVEVPTVAPQIVYVTQPTAAPTPQAPQVVYVTPAPVMMDYSSYIASMIQFLDTCAIVASQSSSGGSISSQLASMRSEVVGHQASNTATLEYLSTVTSRVNALLGRINSLPRKTVSEVWIDPEMVGSEVDQKKIDQLVVQESGSKVSMNTSPWNEDLTKVEIPNLFSLSVRRHSRNHRVKIFKDVKSKQIKLVATCGFRNFKKGSGERFFFSFTCEDSSRSFTAMADPKRRNKLAMVVLKTVCHSKDLAKKLVLDPTGKANRCSLSKWSELAAGMSRPKFFSLDFKGKRIWKMLEQGGGCFSKNESEINSSCSSRSKRRKTKKSSRKQSDDE